MANMCANFLFIIGGEEDSKRAFLDSFEKMERKQDLSGNYQFPEEIERTLENDHSFCDIDVDEFQETLSFLSRWSSPIRLLKDMGKHHKVSFRCDFDEGAHYYGAIFYYHETNSSKEVMLDKEDLSEYWYDNDEDIHHFRGKTWDSDTEILDILLTEKIEKNN